MLRVTALCRRYRTKLVAVLAAPAAAAAAAAAASNVRRQMSSRLHHGLPTLVNYRAN